MILNISNNAVFKWVVVDICSKCLTYVTNLENSFELRYHCCPTRISESFNYNKINYYIADTAVSIMEQDISCNVLIMAAKVKHNCALLKTINIALGQAKVKCVIIVLNRSMTYMY